MHTIVNSKKVCSICGQEYSGFGNNPAPLKRKECCDECNSKIVVPLRIFLSGSIKNRALVIKPNGSIDSIIPSENKLTLKQTQLAVEGYIEIYPVPVKDDNFYFIVNEEGILQRLPFNELAYELFNINIVGNLIVCPKNLFE